MRNSLKISTIAVLAALLVLPASAATINLGGNGGLLGNGGGNGGDLLNLGGNNGGNTATVTSNGLLGNDGNNGGNNDATATAALGGLGNGTNDPTTGNVNLGGTGGTNGNVLLDLFGAGSDPDAAVTLGGGNNTAGLLGSGDTSATLDLFGNGDGTGGTGTGGTGIGGDGGTGGIGGSGGDGAGGFNSDGSIRIASLDAATGSACFTPNSTQTVKLVNRHAYVGATFAGWGGVTNVKVVDAGLCNGAGADIVGQPNIARLQAFIASHPSLRSSISRLGHSTSDVIGVDRNGQTLIVYVM